MASRDRQLLLFDALPFLRPAVGIFTLGAPVEFIADQLPTTAARTTAVPLAARIVMGLLTGACLGTTGGASLPTAWLINASRGPIVDEQALISVLKNKQIAGVAIDVFDMEPLPPSPPFRTLQRTGNAAYRLRIA